MAAKHMQAAFIRRTGGTDVMEVGELPVPEPAATVLHGVATAHIGRVREARLRAGQAILVEGAGGADVVLDYRSPTLWEQVAAAAADGLDVWWDCSGQHRFAQGLPLLAPQARVVVMSGLPGAQPALAEGGARGRIVVLP